MRNYEKSAAKTYEHLLNKCPIRNRKIIVETYADAVTFIEEIEKALCRVALVLGDIKPKNDVDESIRDLFAEIFDSLLCAKNVIYEGYVGKAFPLMRQGYELMELMIYFILNPDKESKWRGKADKKGKPIEPQEIREFLKTHPRGGDATFKQELYKYFSYASHTNRKYIPYRQLGITNRFTLGNFANPVDAIAVEQLIRLIQLYVFLKDIVFTQYEEEMTKLDSGLPDVLDTVTGKRATAINIKLKRKFEALLPRLKTK